MILYGIKNCDTVKKARNFLNDAGVDYQFHDFRADGLTLETIKSWLQSVSWETLLNRRGTTWRKLPQAQQENLNENKVCTLFVENPTLIKRPVCEYDGVVIVGFDPQRYSEFCA